jgi:hypothetical protein
MVHPRKGAHRQLGVGFGVHEHFYPDIEPLGSYLRHEAFFIFAVNHCRLCTRDGAATSVEDHDFMPFRDEAPRNVETNIARTAGNPNPHFHFSSEVVRLQSLLTSSDAGTTPRTPSHASSVSPRNP